MFKLIALRPLEGCRKSVLKCLREGQMYYFCNDYRITKDGMELRDEYVRPLPEDFFRIQTPSQLQINVSAVVGMNAWHSQHDQVAPISNYLIRSMKYDTPFDAPDFLILAHALDGYFKRFINGQDGKDTQQYKHGIDKLLKRFSKVDAVRKCSIDSEALRDSRDKYSHPLPDGDNNAPKAVKGPELYWLTAKCKVLLSCCILDMLGLSIDEINECSKNSPISLIVNSIPLEFKV